MVPQLTPMAICFFCSGVRYDAPPRRCAHDLRNASDDDIAFDESEQQYVDFTRQVFAAGDDEDADFDESAVQLSMTLVFGPATGDEPSSNQWIENPYKIVRDIETFRNVPFVQRLLGARCHD